MNKITAIFFFGILCPALLWGQGETRNWYFGNGAGIQFNVDGSVTPLDGGRLNTVEGCTTISDANGNLLFYTNGINVYRADHAVMQNGTGLFGDTSSSQSAIIVPDPGNTLGYYVFTVDTNVQREDIDNGFNYSYVDMSLDNGLGAVTIKNQNLLERCSEKISAVVKDCDENSFWVITLAPSSSYSDTYNTFYSYEVGLEGVGPPVTSSMGLNITDKRGYLKLSPNGEKLACANGESGMFLFDFDADTGRVSNPLSLQVDVTNFAPYGVEFSSNNRFLYVHSSNDNFEGPHSSSLIQYDLDDANPNNSRRVLDERAIFRGALQLGPNGKIYRALSQSYQSGTNYLGVIENPDDQNTTYTHDAINLGTGNYATQGLPPFVQSFFDKIDIIRGNGTNSGFLPLCVGDSYSLEAPIFLDGTYSWYKDDVQLPGNGHLLEIDNAAIEASGMYRVQIDRAGFGGCPVQGRGEILVEDIPAPVNAVLIQCDSDTDPNDGIATFNLYQALDVLTGPDTDFSLLFYENQQDVDDEAPIANPERYQSSGNGQQLWVRAINNAGCSGTAQLTLQTNPVTIVPSEIQNFYGCDEDATDNQLAGYLDLDFLASNYEGFAVSFYADLNNLTFEENALTGTELLEDGTTIYVRLENDGQCADIELIILRIDPKPVVNIPIEIPTLCLNDPSIFLEAEEGFQGYEWIRIMENGTHEVVADGRIANLSQGGEYLLQITRSYTDANGLHSCSNTASFTIPESNIASFAQEPEILDVSENNIVTIFVEGEGEYEYALHDENGPYQDTNVFQNVPAGFIEVFVRDKNGCGLINTTVSVVGHDKFFTPNNDGVNDFWQIKGIDDMVQADSFITIYDRYGTLLGRVSPNTNGWDGKQNGRLLPASDYWFRVQLQDGREFKGHFTLKR
ncbi:T9SS type B sorting domain-containing protein [Kriegella aquimaris]|uniref:Gliding motility-associated C-terminal domain-containing protein n=1 Tax=Kriegella aquimaris TaxID=192904 RepID=A0A1G9XNF6_9FLAO|nr:T9SS type B sorting domain-containing protein [Kriegella aquimaris]SDM98399.1 gliding motility-associated C-terminal domain-containing protein [Kriegella aquimaris]